VTKQEQIVKLEIFDPSGSAPDAKKYRHAPRLSGLNGKTIGEISNRVWASDRIFPVLRGALKQRFPDIKIVPYTEFPSGADEIMENKQLPELVLTKGCDAVIGASAG
jgi:hypothetical protein